MGSFALSTRNHAVNNPAAFFYGKPLTLDEHQNARMICDPLRLFDCCQETDGACAAIITTPERARDLRAGGAVIRGIGQAAGGDQEVMTSFYRESVAAIPEMDSVAKQTYEMSGLGPDDLDAAIIYDAFSSIVLMQLESFGLCAVGEAKDFVANGNLELGGRLPTARSVPAQRSWRANPACVPPLFPPVCGCSLPISRWKPADHRHRI